jgi:hypothetical protein
MSKSTAKRAVHLRTEAENVGREAAQIAANAVAAGPLADAIEDTVMMIVVGIHARGLPPRDLLVETKVETEIEKEIETDLCHPALVAGVSIKESSAEIVKIAAITTTDVDAITGGQMTADTVLIDVIGGTAAVTVTVETVVLAVTAEKATSSERTKASTTSKKTASRVLLRTGRMQTLERA